MLIQQKKANFLQSPSIPDYKFTHQSEMLQISRYYLNTGENDQLYSLKQTLLSFFDNQPRPILGFFQKKASNHQKIQHWNKNYKQKQLTPKQNMKLVCLTVCKLQCLPSLISCWRIITKLLYVNDNQIYICLMKLVNWLFKKNDKKQEEQVDQDQLKKKGFNPEGLEVQEVCEQPIGSNFDKDYINCISPTTLETQQLISTFKYFPNDEEHRHEHGYHKGGIICADKMQVNKIRSVGKQMIKLIGKKIISGDLNLTKISFPIKAMVPKTALQNSTMSCCMNPYFMKRACQTKDPIERFKYVITNTIAASYYITMFLKPLNPIIGQTLQGSYPDGTQIFCEQISHHPPISYFLAIGPEKKYRYYGCYNFEAHAGLNSASLVNKGYKVYEFANGDRVDVTFSKELYSGLFVGTLRSEASETITFIDKENDLKAEITFGKVKKRPSDYFQSYIYWKGKPICSFQGTYCGYVNFEGVRYWDGRFLKAFKINLNQSPLESDSLKRSDIKYLKQGKLEQAQKVKEELQERQRRDVKLRDKFGAKK